MKFVVFGVTETIGRADTHATPWVGLVGALTRRGHSVTFFERDEGAYDRDPREARAGDFVHYAEWAAVTDTAREHADAADVAIVASDSPDSFAAAELILGSTARCTVFYDLDTPTTLADLARSRWPDHMPRFGLEPFDLVLTITGGPGTEALRSGLGARLILPLYASVDPELHRPAAPVPAYSSDIAFHGDRHLDREDALDRLFLAAARRLPRRRFLLAGNGYPDGFPGLANVTVRARLAPNDLAAALGSATLSLDLPRETARRFGWCPSERLFIAAASGAAILTEPWDGLTGFFEPGREILVATETDDVTTALMLPRNHLADLGRHARDRVLAQHTAEHRVGDLRAAIDQATGRA